MAKKPIPNFDAEPGSRAASAPWRLGAFELEERLRELSRGGQPVPLEDKPTSLLMLLLRHPGEVGSTQEVAEALWPGQAASDAVIAKCVAKLRTALGDVDQKQVLTVRGIGYRYGGEMRLLRAPAALPAALEAFAEGLPVPGAEGWRLERRLGFGGDTWLRRNTDGEHRVFKFAAEGERLGQLKRELTVHRLLRQGLGDDAPEVRIVGWQFDIGPGYLQLDHLPAGSLVEWFRAQGGAAAVPLDWRLAPAADIARGVAAAHELGVLHKDLKPSNVLVRPRPDGRPPQVLLAGFGVAQLLDDQGLRHWGITRLGFTQKIDASHSGTPAYLAPEVSAGELPTTRSDVYACGVMLFQLVVGDLRRPLAPGWEREVDDPLLREGIAAAADVDPRHRLGDARLLAERLEQLPPRRAALAAEAELRRAADRTLKALARSRQRRNLFASAAAVLGVALLACGGLYLRAENARRDAEAASALARSVNAFLTDDLLAGDRGATVESLLDRAGEQLRQRAAGGGLAPAPAAELGATLARAYGNLGAFDKAVDQAAAAYAHLAPLGDRAAVRPALPVELLLEADARALQGRVRESLSINAEAARLARVRLAAADPKRLEALLSLAWSHDLLDQPAQVVATLAELDALPRTDPRTLPLLHPSSIPLAYAHLQQGQLAQALARLDWLMPGYRGPLGDAAPVETEMARGCLASVYLDAGLLPEAERTLARMRDGLAGKVAPAHRAWLLLRFAEARLQILRGDAAGLAAMQALHAQAAAMMAAHDVAARAIVLRPGEGLARAGRWQEAVALAALAHGDAPEAEARLRRAIALAQSHQPPGALLHAHLRASLARALRAQGCAAEAEAWRDDARRRFDAVLPAASAWRQAAYLGAAGPSGAG